MQHFLDDILSGDYAERAVIAGGFAACPALASDIDVWVLDCNDPEQAREDIIGCWKTLGRLGCGGMLSKITIEEDNHVRVDGSEHSAGYGKSLEWNIVRVGIVELMNASKPFHVLTTDCEDATLLVDTFDISTHAIALYPATMRVVKGNKWTAINVPPVKLRDTPTTAARLQKLCTRYGTANNYVGLHNTLRRLIG